MHLNVQLLSYVDIDTDNQLQYNVSLLAGNGNGIAVLVSLLLRGYSCVYALSCISLCNDTYI